MIDINKIEFKKFPGGELHITNSWIMDASTANFTLDDKVICRIQNSDDLMKLCLFTDAYKRNFGVLFPELILPYIPYARQDRVAANGEALSIKVFANILNSLGYKRVTVLDPHSDVSTALIDNIFVVPQNMVFRNVLLNLLDENKRIDLISPDAGALKKVYKLTNIGPKTISKNIRIGAKHRDTQTGEITGTTVDGTAEAKTAIVVDDICDGGRTFIELAKVVRNEYDKLILCVTHGIFSKGLDILLEFYDEIYTTNSWNPLLESDKNLHVLKVESDI